MRGRIRQLKPELFLDDEFWGLTQQHPDLPLLQGFLGLWCQVDREGRFEWRPAMLKTQVLPYWEGDFGRVLDALLGAGLLLSCEVGGRRYGAIRSFLKHQRPNNREPQSCIPDPLEHAQAACSSVHEPRGEAAEAPRASRPPLPTPDSRLPTPSGEPPDPAPRVASLTLVANDQQPLQPSRREREREAEAARLGTTPPARHRFDPKWEPSEEHRIRGHELGLTDTQILEEAEDCRRKTYQHAFATEDDQFFRELTWLARDTETRKHQEQTRRDRHRFEHPGSERR